MRKMISIYKFNKAFTLLFSFKAEASLVLMALSCLNRTNYYSTIMKAEDYLLTKFNNSNFGSTYETGLAAQVSWFLHFFLGKVGSRVKCLEIFKHSDVVNWKTLRWYGTSFNIYEDERILKYNYNFQNL